ncbi:MAG: PEGA domain-containing protein [Candidatus Manganitrophus sp. SB1]|nr:PEGA domain-containing protein [Candidatus Manganitrophus morganii]
MKPRYRRVFFLGALFLFTIVAPVLILGASGYRYDFQGQALVPTGTLVLKSYPEGAKIRINQREGTDRTPAEIQGLLPSWYVLEVNSEDFRPWRKEVEIQANRITVEDQILLIPKRIAFSSVSAKEIRTFAVSPDGRKLIYVHRKSAEEAESLWLFDLDRGEERLLFPDTDQTGSLSAEDSIDRLLWLADGRGVAFSVSGSRSKRYFILAVREGEERERPFEWTPPERGEVDHWKWTQSGLHLFFMQGKSLYRADYETRSIAQATPDRVQGYALLENYLYFVTASPPVLFRQDLVTGERTPLAELPIEPVERNNPERLVVSPQGKIALIDRHHILWLIDDVPSAVPLPVASGVQTVLFNGDGKRLLYQTKQGIFIYHLEEGKTLGGREAGSFETAVRRKGTVIAPVWYSDQFHILYGVGDTVYITEIGGQAPPNTYPLFRIPGEAPQFVYHDNDQVTFLFRKRLYQADLSFGRPRSTLLGSRL